METRLFYFKVLIACKENLTLKKRGSWMLLDSRGGGLNQPTPSRSPQNTVKKQIFFDFLKVLNEIGKVAKFWTSEIGDIF